MTQLLGKIVADFESQLAAKISVGDTAGTLVSATDDDGVALPSGRYFFTIDKGNSKKEHISCDLSGTALTNIKSVSRQGVETTGVVREHRVGANVIISDFAHIKKINDLLDGTTSFDSATPLGYDGAPSITTGNQLTTKTYVDTQDALKVPLTYLDTDPTLAADSDSKVATQKAIKEYALPKTGGTMTGALILSTSSPSTSLEAASKGYADGLAIAGSPDSSTTVKGIAKASVTPASPTSPIFVGDNDPRVPTQSENDALVGTGTPSSSNKYVTNDTLTSKVKFGGTGVDGALAISSGTTNIDLGSAQVVVKNYTSISITGTGALTFTNPHANGTTIIFKSQGGVTITTSATRAIDLRGLGSTGGNQIGPASGGTSASIFGSGASVANNGTTSSISSFSTPSGANNSYGPFGVIYSGNTLAQNSPLIPTGLNITISKLIPIQPSTGGSSGHDPFNALGMAGGRGAGALYIECAGAYNVSGTIDASGTAGTNATGSGISGHGGGGGCIVCLYNTLTSDTGTYTITGGAGGTGGAGSGNAGGAGYVYRGLNTEFA